LKAKKIFILLPDGVGLRNFAFTFFAEIGQQKGWEVVFWNQTHFDLNELGYKEIKLQGKPRAFTDLLKRAKINAELDLFEQKFNDPVYHTYKFPPSNSGIKAKIKNVIVYGLRNRYKGENGLRNLRKKLKKSERKSSFYQNCKKVLKKEKPDLVFCTNQRPVNAIAPLTAAQDLRIPTLTFIFSWDNLPKATMIIEPNFYFVWSEYMQNELLKYYPNIKERQVFITGSPQFEPNYNASLQMTREDFFAKHNLDPAKDYVCFSGNDKTTCPDDQQYLNDIAEAVTILNNNGDYNLGIIFRRCPVDFSDRYDWVLEKNKGLIIPISPNWKQIGESWNTILPTIEDVKLQINTILHTKAVVNLGSSMVFDFASFNKPCLFINYDVERKNQKSWSTKKVYDFVHFRSMPVGKEVIWLNSKQEICTKIETALGGAQETVAHANVWFKKINHPPASNASERIWTSIEKIYTKCT
jgi:hypothetical protein